MTTTRMNVPRLESFLEEVQEIRRLGLETAALQSRCSTRKWIRRPRPRTCIISQAAAAAYALRSPR